MDDFQTTSKLNLIQSQSSSHSSTIKKNQILIKIFFSLIILLALVTGAIIINLVQKYNVAQQKLRTDQQNESVRAFCSATRHPDSCITSITVFTVDKSTSPGDIFNASLQVAIREVTSLTSLSRALILRSTGTELRTRNESALFTCSSLIDDSLSQLSRSLASSSELPVFGSVAGGADSDKETLVYDKIKDMKPWVNDAWRDLWSCFGILGKEDSNSTAAIELRSGVHLAIMYVSNIYDFLEARDGILEQIRYLTAIVDDELDFEYLTTLMLFAPQYFVLIFLLCLFFRIY